MHGILGVATVIAVASIGALAQSHLKASLADKKVTKIVDVAVEHTTPLGIEFALSVRNNQSLIEVSHDGDEVIFVSLPSKWKRKEIKGVELKKVGADPEMLGFVRWHFPPGSSITFAALNAPENILLHNPNKVPLKVKYTYEDLEEEEVERNVMLVKDKSVLLWE